MNGLLGDGQIVWSTYLRDDASHRIGMPFKDRCLPTTAISTGGLLLLTARWSSAVKERGGIGDAESRAASSELFAALLSGRIASRPSSR